MSQKWSYTQAEAVSIAQRFDVVVGLANTFKDHVAAMKAANPKLRVLAYLNATFGSDGLNAAWYAKGSAGQRVEARNWRGTYMMDLNNTGWSDYVRDQCRVLYVKGGYDGCLLDVLGSGPLQGDYLMTPPINSRTGKVWTQNEWIAAAAPIAQKARDANAPKIVIGNGLGSGRRYYDPTMLSSPLVPPLHGAEPELWLREPGAGVTTLRKESDWKKDIDMVLDSQSKGRPVFTMTKLWVTATTAQKNQWHEYAYASFLLCTDGTSYFAFYRDKDPATIVGRHPIDQFDIGTPTGSYTYSGGVYRRSFTGGLVLVNPSQTTVTVSLGATYKAWDGTSYSSVTLAPGVGKVLKR